VRIFDRNNQERDLAWLRQAYGPVEITPMTGPGWYVLRIHESTGPAVQMVRTLDESGQPLPDLHVAFYWPDAPADQNAGPASGLPDGITPGRCVHGPTNVNGDIGFGLGPGAYYGAHLGEKGPHAVWIYGAHMRSQVVAGLGMPMGTPHDTLAVVYQLRTEDEEPPAPPEEDPTIVEVVADISTTLHMELAKIGDTLLDIAVSLAAIAEALARPADTNPNEG
jgi:hypothetical protein